MQIEYVRGCENAIADALSRLDSVSIDVKVLAKLARDVTSYACPVAEVDRFDARTDWIAQQSADPTIARVIHLNANARRRRQARSESRAESICERVATARHQRRAPQALQ